MVSMNLFMLIAVTKIPNCARLRIFRFSADFWWLENSLEDSIFDLRQEGMLAAGVPCRAVSNL